MTMIALIDKDEHVLTSVSTALKAEGYRAQAYSDGATALSGLQDMPPDVAVLEIGMPRIDGMEVLRRLRQHSELPVILVTSKVDEIDELIGFKMGADDFIRKPFSHNLLIERVKAVLRRTSRQNMPMTDTQDSNVIERGKLKLDPERHLCTWDANRVDLSVSEFLLLQALAQRPEAIKSRSMLMDAIGDDRTYFGDRSVEDHIKRTRRKFAAVDEEFNAIETHYGIGYRFKLT